MTLMKLTRMPDGATVYVSPAAVAALVRNPDGAGMAAHTGVYLVAGGRVNVFEKLAAVVEMMGANVTEPPAPPAAGVPEPAPSRP